MATPVKKTATPKAGATRSILVRMSGGETKVVRNVPANAKITFGTIHAGTEKGFGGRGYALRIYTTQNNQLAVFTNVAEFRDLSLTVERKVTNLDHSQTVKHDKNSVMRDVQETTEDTLIVEEY